MKKWTIRYGAPRTRTEAEKIWLKCWKKLSQKQIQTWIERISRHIQKIIRLDEGNEYKKGRDCDADQIRIYDSELESEDISLRRKRKT